MAVYLSSVSLFPRKKKIPPVKFFKKVPVKNKNAREKSKKSGREKQNLPVKIFEKCEFLKIFTGK